MFWDKSMGSIINPSPKYENSSIGCFGPARFPGRVESTWRTEDRFSACPLPLQKKRGRFGPSLFFFPF
jgi:hypothetical protein